MLMEEPSCRVLLRIVALTVGVEPVGLTSGRALSAMEAVPSSELSFGKIGSAPVL
jgi:hypothetical protein